MGVEGHSTGGVQRRTVPICCEGEGEREREREGEREGGRGRGRFVTQQTMSSQVNCESQAVQLRSYFLTVCHGP